MQHGWNEDKEQTLGNPTGESIKDEKLGADNRPKEQTQSKPESVKAKTNKQSKGGLVGDSLKEEQKALDSKKETGTRGTGVYVSASTVGFGVGAGLSYVTDKKGNSGIEGYVDYGATAMPGLGVNLTHQSTNATSISDLEGTSMKSGLGVNTPIASASAGAVKGDG